MGGRWPQGRTVGGRALMMGPRATAGGICKKCKYFLQFRKKALYLRSKGTKHNTTIFYKPLKTKAL